MDNNHYGTIAVSTIAIPTNRQRREFEPESLMRLTESIAKHGLMHPLVCRLEAGGFLLVAGERRLRAIKDLWALGGELRFNGQIIEEGRIPYVTLGELDELSAAEAELEENVQRSDLTWQERADALRRLDELRTAQAKADGRVHTPHDTIEEVTGARHQGPANEVRKSLIVAKHLSDPEVAKAKTVDDAFKILKRREEVSSNLLLASKVDRLQVASRYSLIQSDAILWLANECAAETFDVILTDPPYGIDADKFGDAGGRLEDKHEYDDSYETWQGLMKAFAPESFRVTKKEAHLYAFCDIDRFHELRNLLATAGWQVFRTPLIAYKKSATRVPLPDHGPRRHYEVVLYAFKGGRRVTAIYPDVIECKADDNLGHPAQKPVSLYVDLLRRSVRPGDKVLDPFAGSGTIFAAAQETKTLAVGIEGSAQYYAIALKRVQELERTLTLPNDLAFNDLLPTGT